MQVAVPPGVGSGYGHFEVFRGWGLMFDTRGYNSLFLTTRRP